MGTVVNMLDYIRKKEGIPVLTLKDNKLSGELTEKDYEDRVKKLKDSLARINFLFDELKKMADNQRTT